MRRWVLEHLLTVLPVLDEGGVQELLNASNAWSNWGLRQLHDHLYLNPDAILQGSDRAPQALIRLAHVLHDSGHAEVALPACTACGLTTSVLFPTASGNVCQRCRPRPKPRICARCGQLGTISAQRPEGYICVRCYRLDPQVVEVCGKCGRERAPATRLEDGTPLCNNCQPRRKGVCIHCGELNISVRRMTHHGPVCPRCYREHSQPRRVCGVCGEVQLITQRASAESPDICRRCYRRPAHVAPCSACKEERLCTRMASGELICWHCRPQPEHVCARCGRTRVISAYWPAGAICEACYKYARFFGGRCPRCGRDRTLIGSDASGRAICGPCAGAPEPPCLRCGNDDRGVFAAGRCDRCALELRLDTVLGSGSVAFAPLRSILDSSDSPRQVIRWLAGTRSAKMLARVAAAEEALTHELLDRFPQGHVELYLRMALVRAGLLPAQHEEIERVTVWLEQVLADRPDEVRLVRPFTHWALLRRARKRADRKGRAADYTGRRLRAQVTVALEFLAWHDQRGLTLSSLRQEHVDEWLVSGNASRQLQVGPFLSWAAQRGLTDKHAVPTTAQRGPTEILITEEQRWQQLRACVNDVRLPLEARAAGALALLYGLTLTQIRRLTSADISTTDEHPYLKVGRRPLFLPPRIATLLQELAASPRRRSLLPIGGPPWLFPGVVPGEPLSGQAIGDLLQRHVGITTRASRQAALIAFAEELPPPVLADLLGLTVQTAQRWASYTQPDWAAYLAVRTTASAGSGKECQGV